MPDAPNGHNIVVRGRKKEGVTHWSRANRLRTMAPSSAPFRVANRSVHSLHDATIALLDGSIDALTSSHDDEAVHAARKACKRVRAALRLLRECLGPTAYRRENRAVRDASKPLTAVRDAFMLRRTLRGLPLRNRALQRRLETEYRFERKVLSRRGARTALHQLQVTRERLLDVSVKESEVLSATDGLRRIFKAGRKAFLDARSKNDQALHEWRKQAKYLLNQLDILTAVFNVKFKKYRRRAKKLAEILGKDHDLAVLVSKLRRKPFDAPSETKHIKRKRSQLQARAFRLGKKLYRLPAKNLADISAGVTA
jgi:CHAD domain-containing protein